MLVFARSFVLSILVILLVASELSARPLGQHDPFPSTLAFTVTPERITSCNSAAVDFAGTCFTTSNEVLLSYASTQVLIPCDQHNKWQTTLNLAELNEGEIEIEISQFVPVLQSASIVQAIDVEMIDYEPIRTANDLSEVGGSGSYLLCNDIDLTGESDFTGILNFYGVFNGGNNTISNFVQGLSGSERIGLFKRLAGSFEIADLRLEKFLFEGSKSGYSYVGALAARALQSTQGVVRNVHADRVLISNSSTNISTIRYGGLIGDASGGIRIEHSSVNQGEILVAAVEKSSLGGLVGSSSAQILGGSATNIQISGGRSAGGLVGDTKVLNGIYYPTISRSRALAHINTDTNAGGLVGLNEARFLQVSDSYAMGSVSAKGDNIVVNAAGLVGGIWINPNNQFDVSLTSSFFAGSILSDYGRKSGLVSIENDKGGSTKIIHASYWDKEYFSASELSSIADLEFARDTSQLIHEKPNAEVFSGWKSNRWSFVYGLYPELHIFTSIDQKSHERLSPRSHETYTTY